MEFAAASASTPTPTLPPRGNVAKEPASSGPEQQKVHINDWTRHARTMKSRSGEPMPKFKLEEVASHKSRFDCWTALNGKVYNITPYLIYHPGGFDKVMEAAGIDCTDLFNKYHSWVNGAAMLSKCQVGILDVEESLSDKGVVGSEVIEKSPDNSEQWATNPEFVANVLSSALSNLEMEDDSDT